MTVPGAPESGAPARRAHRLAPFRELGSGVAILAAGLLAFAAPATRAQDPFEIQVYDSETAPPGETGIEVHTNHIGAAASAPGAAPNEQGVHLTFEPHVGLADWAELGGYLQTAVRPDSSYEFAGAKLRLKARVPRRLGDRVGLALNGELSVVPRAYSSSRYGAEVRPIVDVRLGPAYLAINPILDFDLEGGLAGRPQLEPAAKGEVMLAKDLLGVGAEYYGAVGPLDAPLGRSEQVHRLFGVVDLPQVSLGPVRLGLNVGVGRDLRAGGEWIVKSIVGVQKR